MTLGSEVEVGDRGGDRFADPVSVAVHLRPVIRTGIDERFAPSDPARGRDIAAHPRVAKVLRNRKFQFFLILPNQLVFWLVILLGLVGTVVPGLNFATAITWYIWFCLVFVMMVVVGRAWCAMCPFGGFAEWVQRLTFWNRTQRRLGLGRRLPESVARYGFLLSVASFLLLTWVEEYFNIAGPGGPWATSFMVLGIVAAALAFFLIFERRTFCRYFCPLSALIGTVGAMGSVAGFRARDREVCLTCATKECMRGGVDGYGCPWYTWPASADSNLSCGLCSECYKGCSHDNIGLFLQPPLTSVIAPTRRRADVAWSVALLWGLVVYQQFNATNVFASIDGWLNRVTHLAYPNPVDYVGIIALVALATSGVVKLAQLAVARRDLDPPGEVRYAPFPLPTRGAPPLTRPLAGPAPEPATAWRSGSGSLAEREITGGVGLAVAEDPRPDAANCASRPTSFRYYFLPLMYGLIPVVGADFFARQLPKFFQHATRIVPAVGHLFGAGSVTSSLYNVRLLANPTIVAVQVAVVGLGAIASMWASWKISGRELVAISRHPVAARLIALALPLACGVVAASFYVAMHAAA